MSRLKRKLILNPDSDQGRVILKLLRKYYPDREALAGVLRRDGVTYRLNGDELYLPNDSCSGSSISDCIIPTGAQTTRWMLERGDIRLGKIVMTRDALRVYDKMWAIERAASIGLPVPTTWRLVTEIQQYPVFYKTACEEGGGRRGIAWNRADLVAIEQEDKHIYQELIEGEGTYGVAFLAASGELLATCSHYERASFPGEGGSAVIIERFEDDRLVSYAQRLIRAIGYSGWGLAEFKFCKNRQDYVFMEINGKFWASCEFTFRNEPLFLKLLFDIDSNEVVVERLVYLDRALARGFQFVLGNMQYILGSKIVIASGDYRKLLRQVIPAGLKSALRRA